MDVGKRKLGVSGKHASFLDFSLLFASSGA